MMIRQHASILQSAQWVARGVFAAAMLAACGQDSAPTASTNATDDLSSAYESLSRSLQVCEDAQTACTTAAAGDATKIAACDSQAADCKGKTKPAEADARKHLCDAAEGCARGHHGDDDGGVKDHGELHHCVEQHAPKQQPGCITDLFTCLDKAGIRESSMQLSDAAKAAITACAETAHTCFMTDMEARRHDPRGPAGGPGPGVPGGDHHDGAAGGRPTGGFAGGHAFPSHPEAGGPAHPAAAGSDGRGHHDEAGAEAHAHDAAGAPGRGNGFPGRKGEGGAGGGH